MYNLHIISTKHNSIELILNWKKNQHMNSNTITCLEWDSNFLGIGVGKIKLDTLHTEELALIVELAKQQEIRLLYLITSPEDKFSNHAARSIGALLMDRKITFLMGINKLQADTNLSSHIRPAVVSTPGLESLALQSGEYSRFRIDSHFIKGTYERLYIQWLNNSLARITARNVLVHQSVPDGYANGFLTLDVKDNRADIGLLAVDYASRGKGIGYTLIEAARHFTAAWELSELQVVTQLDNVAACNFYRRCGFKENRVEHIYHLWLNA